MSGKSWLMSQVYDYLEPRYNRNKVILDGCHWFNCDVGVYGTENGKAVVRDYLKILKTLEGSNLILEKFHLSDIIYNRLHWQVEVDFREEEEFLKSLNFKIILVLLPPDRNELERRIKDRLGLYPHYERILRDPEWYLAQQSEYLKEIGKTSLPHLIIETEKLPDQKLVEKILKWIGEK